MIKDRETGKNKGTAVLDMTTACDAQQCINVLHEAKFAGRALVVRFDKTLTNPRGDSRQAPPQPHFGGPPPMHTHHAPPAHHAPPPAHHHSAPPAQPSYHHEKPKQEAPAAAATPQDKDSQVKAL